MCGIVGTLGKSDVNQSIYDALIALQHRGQDAAGMVVCENGRLSMQKANGLVRDVFQMRHMLQLRGNMGIGHVRYPTAGSSSQAEAQPFYVNSPYGISLVHNGNLTNAKELKQALFQADRRHLNTSSDSEILLNVFAHELQKIDKLILSAEDIFAAVKAVHQRCKGAYAAAVLIADVGIVAFRDPHGIRPLVLGQRQSAGSAEYMVASETVALDTLGFKVIDDVAPGEAVFISKDGRLRRQQCADSVKRHLCLFEFVYLARPDTFIDKVSVYKVRLFMGMKLGEKIAKTCPSHDIDVVIPIPETSRTVAMPLARALGVKFREGFVKNRYIGRTFIMPGQRQRHRSVRQKLNTIELEFKNKNVLLVDDSIVRGTTSREIIQMAREAGAKKVYFASAAPEVRYPNVYGIDMPAANELIAHNKTNEEICRLIGADWLVFQDLQVLIDAVHEGNPDIATFDDSVFTGHYVTGDIDEAYLAQLAKERSDEARHAKGNVDDSAMIHLDDEV